MIRERDKARKLVNLLMEYYVIHEYNHINVDVSINGSTTKIVMEGSINPELVDIKDIENILGHPRIAEYDDYYDGLLKSSDENELNSIGYLLDDFSIELNDDILLIKIYREHLTEYR